MAELRWNLVQRPFREGFGHTQINLLKFLPKFTECYGDRRLSESKVERVDCETDKFGVSKFFK